MKKGIICVHKHQKAFMNKFIGARRRLLRVGRRQVIQVRCGFDRPTGTRWRQRRRRRRRRRAGKLLGSDADDDGYGEKEREGEEASKKEREWPPRRGRSDAGWVSYRGYAAHQNTIFEQVQRSKMGLAWHTYEQGGSLIYDNAGSSDLKCRVCNIFAVHPNGA